ncbi:MAG: PsiF family protein, partial [Burkholderiaceae bacterium]
MIRQWLIAACVAVPLTAMAADKEPTAQQQKMTACNKEAGDKKLSGDARKSFMSQCLSADGKPAAASAGNMTQQDKMTA